MRPDLLSRCEPEPSRASRQVQALEMGRESNLDFVTLSLVKPQARLQICHL